MRSHSRVVVLVGSGLAGLLITTDAGAYVDPGVLILALDPNGPCDQGQLEIRRGPPRRPSRQVPDVRDTAPPKRTEDVRVPEPPEVPEPASRPPNLIGAPDRPCASSDRDALVGGGSPYDAPMWIGVGALAMLLGLVVGARRARAHHG